MRYSGPGVRATGASELPEMSSDHGLRTEAKDGLMAQASPVRTELYYQHRRAYTK